MANDQPEPTDDQVQAPAADPLGRLPELDNLTPAEALVVYEEISARLGTALEGPERPTEVDAVEATPPTQPAGGPTGGP